MTLYCQILLKSPPLNLLAGSAPALTQASSYATADALQKKGSFKSGADPGTGRLGRSPSLKPTKITLFTMILHNSENNISKPNPSKSLVMFQFPTVRDLRTLCRTLFYHSSVVKYTSSLIK